MTAIKKILVQRLIPPADSQAQHSVELLSAMADSMQRPKAECSGASGEELVDGDEPKRGRLVPGAQQPNETAKHDYLTSYRQGYHAPTDDLLHSLWTLGHRRLLSASRVGSSSQCALVQPPAQRPQLGVGRQNHEHRDEGACELHVELACASQERVAEELGRREKEGVIKWENSSTYQVTLQEHKKAAKKEPAPNRWPPLTHHARLLGAARPRERHPPGHQLAQWTTACLARRPRPGTEANQNEK